MSNSELPPDLTSEQILQIIVLINTLASLYHFDASMDASFYSAREELQFDLGAISALEVMAIFFSEYYTQSEIVRHAKATTIERLVHEHGYQYARNRSRAAD